ncbi:hypothetical protein ACHMW6_24125 [Pseudoduganella sp. UC29_106]|uniref:hypothetical protein n=1 Tax=Pseudoduganella sp. UC29_106 TaxID=3374553 RepID=UPI003756FD2E
MSKSLFQSNAIHVKGFPWCKDAFRTVGIESLTAKILCQNHNNSLSRLDAEASAVFDAIREFCRWDNIRINTTPLARISRPPTMINARLLERWFLKTLLNLSLSHDYYIGPHETIRKKVPLDIVEICYGHKTFESAAGMYAAARPGMIIESSDTLHFAPLLSVDRLLGGFFEFRGFRFFLNLMPDDLPNMANFQSLDPSWQNASLLRPIEKIQMQISNFIFVPLFLFDWNAASSPYERLL